jgi:addiction module HigA family antidote
MENHMKKNTNGRISDGMRPIHPGEILKEEFLEPLNLSANRLASLLKVTPARIYEIIAEKRGITAETALRLATAFGTTAQFWLNLQMAYDIRTLEISEGKKILKEVHPIEELVFA